MSKTHFRWHFWPFQSNTKLFFQNFFTKWPAAPIDKITILAILRIFFLNYKMAAVGHFGCPKFNFWPMSGQIRSIRNFLFFLNFFTKWPPADILAISDRYRIFFGGHFVCRKITFDCISDRSAILDSEIHLRWHFWPFQIHMDLNFIFFIFDKMSGGHFGHFRSIQNHFRLHFWPFLIDQPF